MTSGGVRHTWVVLKKAGRFISATVRAFFVAIFSPDPSFATALDQELRTPEYRDLDTAEEAEGDHHGS